MKHVDKMEAHEIKMMFKAGMSKKDIAYVVQRSRTTIDKILGGDHKSADERAYMHDRMLGEITSGCYDSEGEQHLPVDPTYDYAEKIQFLERNEHVELIDLEEDS